MLGDTRAERRPGHDADRLGQRRRQPDRDAAGQAARRPARADRRRRDARERVSEGGHERAARAPGSSASTIQFHGSADRYTLNGATAVATLYSNATTATANPAVTLRSVGSSGGQAAAFTYDLARSVVYTRQGNPAWAGQERDGVVGIRPDDMFYGAKAGDVQPDWIDTSKIAIPQADEQQRLLVNLITLMERDKLPLPHFWYLPRGEEGRRRDERRRPLADQAPGGTASNFDRFKALSPPGCVVANWECMRATSYIYPDSVAHQRAGGGATSPTASRSRCTRSSRSCPTTPLTAGRARRRLRHPARLRSSAKYTSLPGAGLEPHALRLLARLGLKGQGRARRAGSGWTPTTTTTRQPGSARSRAS